MTIPINSINKQEPDTQVNSLLKENARVRKNNMELKFGRKNCEDDRRYSGRSKSAVEDQRREGQRPTGIG